MVCVMKRRWPSSHTRSSASDTAFSAPRSRHEPHPTVTSARVLQERRARRTEPHAVPLRRHVLLHLRQHALARAARDLQLGQRALAPRQQCGQRSSCKERGERRRGSRCTGVTQLPARGHNAAAKPRAEARAPHSTRVARKRCCCWRRGLLRRAREQRALLLPSSERAAAPARVGRCATSAAANARKCVATSAAAGHHTTLHTPPLRRLSCCGGGEVRPFLRARDDAVVAHVAQRRRAARPSARRPMRTAAPRRLQSASAEGALRARQLRRHHAAYKPSVPAMLRVAPLPRRTCAICDSNGSCICCGG